MQKGPEIRTKLRSKQGNLGTVGKLCHARVTLVSILLASLAFSHYKLLFHYKQHKTIHSLIQATICTICLIVVFFFKIINM